MCVYTYMYAQLNHHAVHLKLTQYCKSTILKLKKTIKEKVYIDLENVCLLNFIEKFSIEIQLMYYNIMFQVTT